MANYHVTVTNPSGNSLWGDAQREADDYKSLAELITRMVGALPTHDDRVKCRMLLKRWLNHPETGIGLRQLSLNTEGVHPRTNSKNWSNTEPDRCVVCNLTEEQHVDGFQGTYATYCEGFVKP